MKTIKVVNEPAYAFGSPDNVRQYPFEFDFSGGYRATSVHGVLIEDEPIAVFGAGGGTTGVHVNSLLRRDDRCYLAVGPFIVCFSLDPFKYNWAMTADQAACFGVHYSQESDALISHGELEVSRFSESGEIVWAASGSDAFTEGFRLYPAFVEVVDFDGKIYRFDYDSGHLRF